MADSWRSAKIRRPRVEVQNVVDILSEELLSFNDNIEFYFGGSWRRGSDTIGDLDILIVTPDGTLNDIKLPIALEFDRQGDKIAQGSVNMLSGGELHIDFWACKPNELGAFLFFITGPKELNIRMRQVAIALGYSLSQVGLLSDGLQVDDGTELDVARKLGFVDMLDPIARDSYSPPVTTWTEVKILSSRGDKTYDVKVSGGQASCSCPGYAYRSKCKHIAMARAILAEADA